MLIIRRVEMTPRFVRSFVEMPHDVQKCFGKQLGLLFRQSSHASLDLKIYDKRGGVWQGRVTRGYRFYFVVAGDLAVLTEIKPHD